MTIGTLNFSISINFLLISQSKKKYLYFFITLWICCLCWRKIFNIVLEYLKISDFIFLPKWLIKKLPTQKQLISKMVEYGSPNLITKEQKRNPPPVLFGIYFAILLLCTVLDLKYIINYISVFHYCSQILNIFLTLNIIFICTVLLITSLIIKS